jgi:hypothetical protein
MHGTDIQNVTTWAETAEPPGIGQGSRHGTAVVEYRQDVPIPRREFFRLVEDRARARSSSTLDGLVASIEHLRESLVKRDALLERLPDLLCQRQRIGDFVIRPRLQNVGEGHTVADAGVKSEVLES